MKKLLILLFAVIAFSAKGQNRDFYRFFYPDVYQTYERLADEFEIVIPPEERIPVSTRSFSVDQPGNWGYYYHGSNAVRSLIQERAKRKVAVFVFDTGAGFTHSNLNLAWWREKSKQFVPDDDTPNDTQSHSTHVSGIIGAVNKDTPIGIAAELAVMGKLKIIPYQVLNDSGAGSFAWATNAVNSANEEAKKLIADGWFVEYNFSLGGGGGSSALEKALDEAKALGVLTFGANGNTYNETKQYPGYYNSVEGVAALQLVGNTTVERANYSTYNDRTAVAAAGSAVYSTTPGNKFASYSGTSMATPTMSGIAAVVASCYPELNAKQVKDFIYANVYDINGDGWDKYTGVGAPLLEKIFKAEPPKGDDPGNDDPGDDEPPVDTPDEFRATRTLTIPVTNANFPVMWKAGNAGKFEWLTITGLEIELKSKFFAGDAYDRINETTAQYFTRRGYVTLPDDDFQEAAYWIRYFYEMMVPRSQKLDAKIKYIEVTNEKGQITRLGGDERRNSFFGDFVQSIFKTNAQRAVKTIELPSEYDAISVPRELCTYEAEILFGKRYGFTKAYADTYTETFIVTTNKLEEIKKQVQATQEGYEFVDVTFIKRVDCINKVPPRDFDEK